MQREIFKRFFFIAVGILLFILSIQVLKSSTHSLIPSLKTYLGFTNNPLKALGFGWLSSYLVLSGSPIAALSLSLLDVGILNTSSSFLMVMGSRLGASLILVVVGVVETLRGRGDIIDTTSIAFLTFFVTYTIAFPALFLGFVLLKFQVITFNLNLSFLSILSDVFRPFVNLFLENLGFGISFISSIGILYLSLSVFERGFRGIELKEVKSSWINYLMEKPHFSFLFGALITLVGQSISLSLGIMIPLYLKGFIQRRNLIPYIMGANITTFIDTLVVSLLLNNSLAFNVVIIAVVSSLIPTSIALLFYKKYYNFITRSVNTLFLHKKALVGFVLFLILFPLSLVLI